MRSRRRQAETLADETAQIFRIYRDVRFSKDPTPYKVRICLALLAKSARGVSVTASPRPLRPSHPPMPACMLQAGCT